VIAVLVCRCPMSLCSLIVKGRQPSGSYR
jgi:hypothetical protein